MLPLALCAFLSGLTVGVVGMGILVLYIGNKSLSEKSLLSPNNSNDKKSIDDRMQRVKDITEEQFDLLAKSDGPQKNGLDGKYKNNINSTIKSLEEEKSDIFRSIINDGFDPEISALDGAGIVSRMKLSEFMTEMGIAMKTATQKTPEPSKTKQIGKFTVHRGGKDDNGDGSTIH